MACILMADSCCDLSQDYLDQNKIEVVHFSYTEADKLDGGLHGTDDLFQSISAHEFYERMRNGACPMTSQPSQMEFEKIFYKVAQTGDELVYLSLSSAVSGCYEGALMALERTREEFGEVPIYVLNTKLASTQLALLVTVAQEKLKDNNWSASELLSWAKEAKKYIHISCIVDDLKALHRGGRLPASVAVAGSMLDVKPLITVTGEGKLGLTGVARGRKKAIKKVVDGFVKNYEPNRFSHKIALGHADCPKDFAELCQTALSEANRANFAIGEQDCITTTIGPTIGSHVGANMLSLAYFAKDCRR